jgi:hypothetical protein
MKWRVEQEVDPAIPEFEEWVGSVLKSYDTDARNTNDVDTLLLCTKPSQKALQYTKMKAFGNHFRVDDETSSRMQTYDSGIALAFDVLTQDAWDVFVNYVGLVKDILKLNYGPMRTPVILLCCEWMKRFDNRGNPTYVRDAAGFLVVIFRHMLPSMSELFIFPSQATQVFFSDDTGKASWKVVLRKEPRARREVADTSDVFITTTVETAGLTAPADVPPPPTTASLDGAVILFAEKHLLSYAHY